MQLNKKIFIVSLIGVIIAVFLFNSRDLGLCNLYCGPAIGKYQDIFLFFPVLLFFSLVTLLAKETVFQAWWKFARWGIPLVLVASFIISLELHHTPGGWFNLDKEVDLVMTTTLYLLFILGSAWQMYRGFRVKE